MSGAERKETQFTSEEERQIVDLALELADSGEETICLLRKERNNLTKISLFLLATYGNEAMDTSRMLEHETEIINKIISHTEGILRERGTDMTSRIRKLIAREAFGSFDD